VEERKDILEIESKEGERDKGGTDRLRQVVVNIFI